jgi:hypothetical protein
MPRRLLLHVLLVLSAIVSLVAGGECLASAFVRGAYYQLGDADPGAVAGAVGNPLTLDSFADGLHLGRDGSPRYTADVPPLGPAGDKLAMVFANKGLGGPAFPGAYSRTTALPMIEQGLALETWVRAGPTNLDAPAIPSIRNEMLAYNGDPAANGFGLFLRDDRYVARVGAFERSLGPADVGTWHHLAYVFALGTSSYYYDGRLVAESTKDPAPVSPTGGFSLGGQPGAGDAIDFAFNGWLDEVRYQTFNPIAAGAFNPTAFLIVPEPAAGLLVGAAASYLLLRRREGTKPQSAPR